MSDHESTVSEYRAKIALIQQTLAEGFPKLVFTPSLEAEYSLQHYALLVRRVPIIVTYSLAMLLIYCVSDYAFLPVSVHEVTIGIRVLVIAPVLGFLVWCVYRRWPYKRYLLVYTGAYFIAGLSIIAIILTARVQNISMPYEGLLLVSLFGYLLLGLPFYYVLTASAILFVLYVLGEWSTGLPSHILAYNSFFLLTANAIGAVGCYLHEQTLRTGFLTQLLVEQSRDEAELENEEKSRLLASASHDLRQPLHAMTLFAETLSRNLPKGETLTTAKHLQSSISHLNQLLGSLLDMSRLQYGVIKLKPSNFGLLPQVEQAVREIYHGDHTQVSIYSDIENEQTYTDPLLLGRILRNLIDNALEHAQANQVRVLLEKREDTQTVFVCVEDNGKGIAEDQLEQIFDEFHQVDRVSASGLGLGLSIVKQMMQMLGLNLQVSSSLGHGSRFGFELPLVSLPERERGLDQHEDSEVVKLPGVRVLMAEDVSTVREAAADLVRAWGYVVDQAGSVKEAEDLLSERDYDLLISDYHFDEAETGFDLISGLRAKSNNLPVIVLTADMQLELDEQALAPVLIAHKPVKPAKLRLMISQLVLN